MANLRKLKILIAILAFSFMLSSCQYADTSSPFETIGNHQSNHKPDRDDDDDDDDDDDGDETALATETTAPQAETIPTETPTSTPSPSPTTSPTPTPKPTDTPTPTPSPTPIPEETMVVESPLEDFEQLAIATEVVDEDDELFIYVFNDEFVDLVSEYWGNNFYYEVIESNTYQVNLDRVLASGENAPDMFITDADWTKKYVNSSYTLPLNSLGLSYDEFSEMYNYTLQMGANEGSVIKAISWQCCPGGVFYRRSLAAEYLGASEPEDVAPFFSSWDSVLQTTRTLATNSSGNVSIVSGFDDTYRAMLATRTGGWVVGGETNVDPVMYEYFDIAMILSGDCLTQGTTQWDAEWFNHMSDGTVLSYWGPMWLARYSMNLGTGDNDTAGDWGLVSAPNGYYWGGSWMLASVYCDNKASVADIMRTVAINPDVLRNMAANGEFVNSISIMEDCASDPNFAIDWLGGQNPAAVLADSASRIDNSIIVLNEKEINELFCEVVRGYVRGDYAATSDALDAFYYSMDYNGYTS